MKLLEIPAFAGMTTYGKSLSCILRHSLFRRDEEGIGLLGCCRNSWGRARVGGERCQ
jgi:hypothetical protein